MTKSPKARVSHPPAGLSSLVNRSGGILRDAAVARSLRNLESQRVPAQKTLLLLIDALDAMMETPGLQQRLSELRRMIDPVIAIADMFGMTALCQAAKRLSELLAAFAARGEVHLPSIAVHLRAMRLLTAPAPDAAVMASVMHELDRVLTHFGAQVPPA